MNKKLFQMPNPVKITGRTSSITNSFVNGIIPVLEPTEEEVLDVLHTLGMSPEHVVCAYCGDPYTEWDHFHPLVRGKQPTGYISEIHNLVPACGKCNQSKGNKYWRDWILSDASLSPKMRGVPELQRRIHYLEQFESSYTPIWIDFEKIIGEEKWKQHWENYRRLHEMMQESQRLSDEIRGILAASVIKG